jgi:hypothetical protein
MAELSQRDQLILHEFSVRYRAGFAKANPTPQESLDTVKDAVREEYEQERSLIQPPDIGPASPTPEREPEEPDQDR